GLGKVLVTHPEHPLLAIGLEEQRALAARGALFERCFCFTVGAIPGAPVALASIAEAIRTVGVDRTVLSTDLGRADLPDPVTGFERYVSGLHALGLSREELTRMCAETPARLLGL